jgi:hypothetical protein
VRDPVTRLSLPALVALHPVGAAPVITEARAARGPDMAIAREQKMLRALTVSRFYDVGLGAHAT